MKNCFYSLFILLFSPIAGAAGNAAWIDAHNRCFEDMKVELLQPGPLVYNYVEQMAKSKTREVDIETYKDWGSVNAFPVLEGDSPQLAILGNGKLYLAQLPVPKVKKWTKYTISRWNLLVTFLDRRPLWITIEQDYEGVTHVNVFAYKKPDSYDASYDDLVEVTAVESHSDQVRKTSADNIVRVLEHNSRDRRTPLPKATKSLLLKCRDSLDLKDIEDQSIEEAILRFLLPKDGEEI